MQNIVEFDNGPEPLDKVEKKGFKLIKALKVIATIFFIFVLLLGVVLIWHNCYYTVFFVNGQSMYPTLNENATNREGEKVGYSGGNSSEGYRVQFGIMDTSKKALSNLKRGDVVITYYKTDYTSQGTLAVDASTKIKRIAGMPGEEVAIDEHGGLLINGEPTELEGKVFYATKPDGERAQYLGILGEDEYFVLGDNRDNSMDSRNRGAIKFDYIIGLAVAVEGTCRISKNADGTSTCVERRYSWPQII